MSKAFSIITHPTDYVEVWIPDGSITLLSSGCYNQQRNPMSLKFFFPLGKVVATPNALSQVPRDEILAALTRHHSCDWGDVCDEDRKSNNDAIITGARLMSSYSSKDAVKFWIITEADRLATTILLPEDY